MEDDSFSPLQTPGLQASVNQELQEKHDSAQAACTAVLGLQTSLFALFIFPYV